MKQFIVEITEQSMGSMRVEAETEEEAEDKVQKTLIQYFNRGCAYQKTEAGIVQIERKNTGKGAHL